MIGHYVCVVKLVVKVCVQVLTPFWEEKEKEGEWGTRERVCVCLSKIVVKSWLQVSFVSLQYSNLRLRYGGANPSL